MRERGMKAILMGHVPPARTESKQLWDETCWQKYTLWLQQYRDVVVGALYGHMNVDHFLIQDTKKIDLALITGANDEAIHTREAMEDELSTESTADYLQELREDWSRLPPPTALNSEEDADVKKDKKKDKKRKKLHWGERYQLSLVSPSIVPNYFPTLRVVEYNISGLEDSPIWKDTFSDQEEAPSTALGEQQRLELRDSPEFEGFVALPSSVAENSKHRKGKNGKKPKKDKDKKPKDPNLTIPEPPTKGSPPGPAYSPQPLTWTGFVQYFANLTHINNDMTPDDNDEVQEGTEQDVSWVGWLMRWREGKHRHREPKDSETQPRKFQFEVEYSTFDDKIYNLNDLTVKSFVELAYRLGQKAGSGKGIQAGAEPDDFDGDDDEEDASGTEDESDSDDDDASIAGKKKKDRKKKKKKNKAWMHFLRHAFVSTVDKEELKKLA
jgi:endopolyphosphatase